MELFTPSFGLVFWMFVSFAVLFFILWKFAWPVILHSVDDRANLIDKGVEYAESARMQLEQAQSTADGIIAEARHKEAEILREADSLKSQIVENARNEAKIEAKKEQDAAKLSIDQARKEAEKNLRDEIGQLAIEIATKVVRKRMGDDKAQAHLVNSLLDEIENQN